MNGRVPPYTLRGIWNYVENHVPPGSFLRAVFEHELFEAFARVDSENQCAMFDIVNYIYNNVPVACHGSPEIVNRWIAQRWEPKNDEATPDVPVSGSGSEGS